MGFHEASVGALLLLESTAVPDSVQWGGELRLFGLMLLWLLSAALLPSG